MGWRTPPPPHLINGPISGAEETGRKRDRVRCSLSARYKITPRIWDELRGEFNLDSADYRQHRGAGKFVNVICFQYSIFSQYSSFFSNVPEFCPFNSKFQQTVMKSYLSVSQFSLTSKISRISIDHYRERCVHKFQHSPSLSALHPLTLELFPACGFNWRWSELSASPLGKLYHWSQTRQQQYFCQLLNYFISLHWLLRGNTSQTLHFQRRVNSKLITLLFNTENFERFLWSVLV